MPRRREVPKRKVLPDPLYNDQLVTKFMNCVMLDGKKAIAEKIVYGAFEIIRERTREEPLKIFHKEFSEQDVFHKVQRSPVRTRELLFKT